MLDGLCKMAEPLGHPLVLDGPTIGVLFEPLQILNCYWLSRTIISLCKMAEPLGHPLVLDGSTIGVLVEPFHILYCMMAKPQNDLWGIPPKPF